MVLLDLIVIFFKTAEIIPDYYKKFYLKAAYSSCQQNSLPSSVVSSKTTEEFMALI